MGINSRHWSDAYILSELKSELPRGNLKELREQAAAKITMSQKRAKEKFDKVRRKPQPFKGQLVMVRKTDSPTTGKSKKLEPLNTGPVRLKLKKYCQMTDIWSLI